MAKIEHRTVVLLVHRYHLVRFRVQHGKCGADVRNRAAIGARPKEGSDHALLCIRAAQIVVKYGEKR